MDHEKTNDSDHETVHSSRNGSSSWLECWRLTVELNKTFSSRVKVGIKHKHLRKIRKSSKSRRSSMAKKMESQTSCFTLPDWLIRMRKEGTLISVTSLTEPDDVTGSLAVPSSKTHLSSTHQPHEKTLRNNEKSTKTTKPWNKIDVFDNAFNPLSGSGNQEWNQAFSGNFNTVAVAVTNSEQTADENRVDEVEKPTAETLNKIVEPNLFRHDVYQSEPVLDASVLCSEEKRNSDEDAYVFSHSSNCSEMERNNSEQTIRNKRSVKNSEEHNSAKQCGSALCCNSERNSNGDSHQKAGSKRDISAFERRKPEADRISVLNLNKEWMKNQNTRKRKRPEEHATLFQVLILDSSMKNSLSLIPGTSNEDSETEDGSEHYDYEKEDRNDDWRTVEHRMATSQFYREDNRPNDTIYTQDEDSLCSPVRSEVFRLDVWQDIERDRKDPSPWCQSQAFRSLNLEPGVPGSIGPDVRNPPDRWLFQSHAFGVFFSEPESRSWNWQDVKSPSP